MLNLQDIMNWNTIKPFLRDRLLSKSLAQRVHGMVVQYIAADIFRAWYAELDDTHLVPVTADLLRAWGIAPADLVTTAEQNTPGRVIPMGALIESGPDDVPMFIVTTDAGRFGASAILYKGVQEELDRIFPTGYLVLPSSVHEVICVPADSIDTEDAAKMVKEINESIVADTDRLSDSVFVVKDGFLAAA